MTISKPQSPILKADIYTRITNQIVAAIEAGADAWQMPWHQDDASARPD